MIFFAFFMVAVLYGTPVILLYQLLRLTGLIKSRVLLQGYRWFFWSLFVFLLVLSVISSDLKDYSQTTIGSVLFLSSAFFGVLGSMMPLGKPTPPMWGIFTSPHWQELVDNLLQLLKFLLQLIKFLLTGWRRPK
ncbi:hypothetical protein [Hymenobacter sp. HDW8]|uniref:hypothetical protein n=1 Tax=Hymenobacter sp. HDW8 TaxID=2714932 RepID=UPI00140CD426|nr:hypothetical protein [Hymenobacter sp. HDW8]QIL78433.1 hypothetical protein G7064_21675 [Hymenobacter sp. HDW8]